MVSFTPACEIRNISKHSDINNLKTKIDKAIKDAANRGSDHADMSIVYFNIDASEHFGDNVVLTKLHDEGYAKNLDKVIDELTNLGYKTEVYHSVVGSALKNKLLCNIRLNVSWGE